MLLSVLVYAFFKLYLILNIFQQAHYQFRFYIKHFIINFLLYDVLAICILTIGVLSNEWFIDLICSIYLVVYSFFYLVRKKSLVFTKRIIRIILMSGIYLIAILWIPFVGPYFVLLNEFSLLPILLLEKKIASLSNRKYIKQTKQKLKGYTGTITAITGSFGKTSTKMLYQQVMKCFYPTAATIKSYNTPLGIAKFINDNPIEAFDELVLEFGASKKGDIKELCSIAQPQVVIVTEIGYMHVETFGSLEAIVEEKMSLVESLHGQGIAVLNYDCDLIRNYLIKNKVYVISYGLKYGDYQARNIQYGEITSFDFYYQNNKIERFEVQLTGKHQILNLVGVLALAYEQGYDVMVLKRIGLTFHVEKNRLEYKKINNRIILDDAFNSNYKGFIEALNVLNSTPGFHILLTPGMVELGRYNKMLMTGVISHMVHSCHAIILIGYHHTKGIYQELKEFPLEVYIVQNFMEGYRLYLSIAAKHENSALLIENDLPDLYRVGFFC